MSEGDPAAAEHAYAVASVEDVPEGAARRVEVEGRALALVHLDGEFYALSDACPHKEARFSMVGTRTVVGEGTHGELDPEECTVKCPYHYWEFDLETGDAVSGSKKRVPTFETTVADGQVWVRLR